MRKILIFVAFLGLAVECLGQCATAVNGTGAVIGTAAVCPKVTLQSITVAPANASQPIGLGPTTYTATGNFSDGSQLDETSSCTWTSSNTSVATIGSAANPQPATCVASASQASAKITCTVGAISNFGQLLCIPQPEIVTTSLPNAIVNQFYNSGPIVATGGTQPYTWTLVGGTTLPPGLVLNNTSPNASISGTPTASGTTNFTLQATDSNSFSDTQALSIVVEKNVTQLPTLPQRWVNARECVGITTSDTIALPSSGTGGAWTCSGNSTAFGPYSGMPSITSLNSAIADAETCRANTGDSVLVQIPHGTLISQSIGANGYINLKQSTSPVDTSTSCIVVDSDVRLPTTDPLSGNPRDQMVGTYNIASSSGLVRSANIVTVTTMNSMPTVPAAGDLASIWQPDDKSFQGQYTVCVPPAVGCITPTATQFTVQQTGTNATTQNGVIFSLQAQNTISTITTSACSTSGGACTVTLDFTSTPNFSVGDRFDIVNTTCTAGCVTGDANALNTTWYIATVTSNSSCATCEVTFNTYTEYIGNGATITGGTVLHYNHILQDQVNCCMWTVEETGGGGDWIFGDTNNYHHYLIADAELRMAKGDGFGAGLMIRFGPNGSEQSPVPPMSVSGCNGQPAQANCDEPVHVGIDRSYLHGFSFPVVPTTQNQVNIGVQMDCSFCYVTNSVMKEIHNTQGAESHLIHVKSGVGPFKIVDNLLEGSSENIFASYVPQVTGLPNGYYCDWEIRRNWLTKSMFDSLNSGGAIPNGTGRYFQYLMKNDIEFKNVCQALIDGNVIQNSAGGVGEQQGALFGNNSTGNNGNGHSFALGAQSHDVTYSNNIYRHAFGGGYYPTRADTGDGDTIQTMHYAWLNNLWYDIGNVTMFGRNGWNGSAWTFAFSDVWQLANRGPQLSCSTATASASGGVTTATLSGCVAINTSCLAPSGALCGVSLQAGDWVSVNGCVDTNYNVIAPLQVPALTSDPTLTATSIQYNVPAVAGASTTGCSFQASYMYPRWTTIQHNTVVQNYNFTYPVPYNNLFSAKAHPIGAEGIMGGSPGAQVMARDWWTKDNIFSLQLPAGAVPQFFFCAPTGKQGTPAQSTCWDSNSMVFIKNGITGFTPSAFTEYNAPQGVPGPNNGVSPPVTDLFGLTSACSANPNNTCIGFVGNYQPTTFGVLGGSNVASNVPDFAPSTLDYHVFALSHGGVNTPPVGNFFVSPTGSDANPGTQALPWASITHAAANLTVGPTGTVVLVLPGTYNECPLTGQDTAHSGTATQRISFISSVQYGAHVQCGGQGGTKSIWINGTPAGVPPGSYIDINGFDITGIGTNPCNGITQYGQFGRILNNRVHDLPALSSVCGSLAGGPGGAGILMAYDGNVFPNDAHDNLIANNIVDAIGVANGPCPDMHGLYFGTSRNTAYNNIESRACGFGIQMFHEALNEVVANNVFANNGKSGILVSSSNSFINDHTAVINNISIANNQWGITEQFGSGTGANNVYRNNITAANGNTTGCSNPPAGTTLCPYNFTFGARTESSTLANAGGLTTTQWNNGAGVFVNYTGNAQTGDFHPNATSFAISNGAPGPCAPGGASPCVPSTDFSGLAVNTPIWIGAYQSTTASGAGSYFASGNPGQASDGTDTGANVGAIDSAITQQQYVCQTSCGAGPNP